MHSISGEDDEQRRLLAKRIRNARERLRLTQQELADRIGVTAVQTVSDIENGKRAVKALELMRIAEALHLSLVDLLEPPQKQPVVLWREQPQDEKERAEAEALLVHSCRNYRLAEEWAGAARRSNVQQWPAPTSLEDYAYAERLAQDILSRLGLGKYPATALVKTLEEDLGVKVLYQSDLAGSAACFCDGDNAAILINSSEAPWRRNYSIAHELFHLLTWDSLPPERLKREPSEWKAVERLANAFAAALLLPADWLRIRLDQRRCGGRLRFIDLIELAREFDVSIDALLWRLVNLRWLKNSEARKYLEDEQLRTLDRTSLRHFEDPPPISERFLNLLITAYGKGKVSAGRIAEMTGLSLVEVRRRLAAFDEGSNTVQAEVPVA